MAGSPTVLITRQDGLGADNPSLLVDGTRWLLCKDGLDGFFGTDVSVSSTEWAQYDGAMLDSERLSAADRTVEFRSTFPRAEARREAEALLRPQASYEVRVKWEGVTRRCVGRLYALTLDADPTDDCQRVTLTILCLDPAMLSADEQRFDLARATGSRGFPFCSFASRVAPEPEGDEEGDGDVAVLAAQAPAEQHLAGFVAGVLSKRIVMTNDGSLDAYPRFEVSATGPVRNPSIKVTDSSGEVACMLGLALSMAAGDVLVADFSARPTTIELNGRNVTNLATRGSTLAAGIAPGDYEIEWSAESGDAAMHVTPFITERYLSL